MSLLRRLLRHLRGLAYRCPCGAPVEERHGFCCVEHQDAWRDAIGW